MHLSTGRFAALRLRPGDDLVEGLDAALAGSGATAAAVVACVGSLTRARLRHANRDEATLYEGHFEIVSLTGTLGPGNRHLHLSMADGEGRVVGGHLLPGPRVYTTAEIVLALLDDLTFGRAPCPLSGYDELAITPAPNTPSSRC